MPRRRARVHRHGQHLDAASLHPHIAAALVQLAEHAVSVAGADRHGADRVGGRGARSARCRAYRPSSARWACSCCAYLGLAISLFPYIVPHAFTLWDAAAVRRTQAFLLIGTLFLLPIIFMYTGWSYWVFRGKVRADIGYH